MSWEIPRNGPQYDRFGHNSVGSSGGVGFDPSIFSEFGDIVGDFFWFWRPVRRILPPPIFRAQGSRPPLRPTDRLHGRGIRTKDQDQGASHGSLRELSGFRGSPPGAAPSTCPTCHGQGQVRYQQGFFQYQPHLPTIARARGAWSRTVVPTAGEKGASDGSDSCKWTIPAGVDSGSKVRYFGEGEGGLQGGPPGDLYVVLRVGDHEIFERQEKDIHCRIPISFTQAALGATIKVPTLEGEETLSIPPGTHSGKVFRLRGKGIPGVNGRGRGDEFVSVDVVTPRKLNREQRRLLEQLAQLTPVENKPLETEVVSKGSRASGVDSGDPPLQFCSPRPGSEVLPGRQLPGTCRRRPAHGVPERFQFRRATGQEMRAQAGFPRTLPCDGGTISALPFTSGTLNWPRPSLPKWAPEASTNSRSRPERSS